MRWMPLALWWKPRAIRMARWVRTRLAQPCVLWLSAYEAGNLVQARHDHDLARIRLAVCAKCPLLVKNFCDPRQGGCGCFMPVKARMSLATCPQGRW
jgi:hypothetical protein